MERRVITPGDFDWNGLIQHVIADQTTVQLEQNERLVASVAPIRTPVAVADLNRVLGDVPCLGGDDVDDFARDIEEAQKLLPRVDDPWGS